MKISLKFFLLVTALICGVLYIIVSLPLVREEVEPNSMYGIRLEETANDPTLWYEVNRYGGWALIVSSLVLLTANILLYAFFRKSLSNSRYTGIFVAILLLCILGSTFFTVLYARSLV